MKRATRAAVLAAIAVSLVGTSSFAQRKTKKPARTTHGAKQAPKKTPASAAGYDLDEPTDPPAKPEPEKKVAQSVEDLSEKPKVEDDGKEKKLTLAGALGLVFPIGKYSTITGVGIGLYGDAEYKITHQIRPTLRLGVQLHFNAHRTPQENERSYSSTSRAHEIPILVGLRYYPVEKGSLDSFFVFGETGLFVRFVSEDRAGAQSVDKGCERNVDGVSCSQTKVNWGFGVGAGAVVGPIELRASFHSYDITEFPARMAVGLSGGYRFGSF